MRVDGNKIFVKDVEKEIVKDIARYIALLRLIFPERIYAILCFLRGDGNTSECASKFNVYRGTLRSDITTLYQKSIPFRYRLAGYVEIINRYIDKVDGIVISSIDGVEHICKLCGYHTNNIRSMANHVRSRHKEFIEKIVDMVINELYTH